MTWSFHMDDLQKNSGYDMIMGQDLLLEIRLDLCFSKYITIGNGGAYKVLTAPMKDTSDLCDGTSFINKELL